ncbi:MAG: SAM-dependent methyltransferase, partial [Candidatus Limnocylindrales bacterium]
MTAPNRSTMTLPAPPATIGERWAESDAALVERLRGAILADGPMTFARYMESVLYDREHGYYVTSDGRTTREGDYLTAPELHPIFGASLAAQIEEAWERLDRPGTFTLREEAAGSGALGLAILDRLVAVNSPAAGAIRYLPIETDPTREASVRERLGRAGHGARLADPDPGASMTGVVVANELLDALPVHRLTVRGGDLLEVHVDWQDGWFIEVARAPSTPALAAHLARVGVDLVEGQV